MNTSSTFFAADGDGYELNMGRWSRQLALRFLQFTGKADGVRAFDVGCGTGHLAAAVASLSSPAATEDEGDGSLRYWRKVHEAYFARECKRLGRTPEARMPVVCEEFKVGFAGCSTRTSGSTKAGM